MVAEGLIVSALVPLTPSEQEKLECKDLEKAINKIADDLHVKWAVEVGNIAIATVSKQFGPVVGESQVHEIEIAATNFMRGIEHLNVHRDTKVLDKTDESEEEGESLDKQVEFAKELLSENWEETKRNFGIAGACIMGYSKELPHGIYLPIGQISKKALKLMLETFVKEYGHE